MFYSRKLRLYNNKRRKKRTVGLCHVGMSARECVWNTKARISIARFQ